MNPTIQEKQNLNLKAKKIHFIGIGGIGMSALARFFHASGSIISGSDKEYSNLITELKKEGCKNIWAPHNKNRLKELNPDYIIYSTAITNNNEELIWAKDQGKVILHRADLLEVAFKSKRLIAVSGTHGKTTTTALICEILENTGLSPSGILGGILISKNSNVLCGNGDFFIAEADESDKSFLKGEPEIAVITNIEKDHLENYKGGIDEILNSFLAFAKKGIKNKGLVACIEDKLTKELILHNFKTNDSKLITYGFFKKDNPPLISTIKNTKDNSWDIFIEGKILCTIKPKLLGNHNILNILAAIGVSYLIGITPEKIKEGIEKYKGVKRRFEEIGKANDITLIDDYAHHPTEITATIQAAKELHPKRLVLVIQPHQPIRLRDLWNDFKHSLENINEIAFITDLYIARGQAIPEISTEKLVKEVSKPNITYLPGNIDEIAISLKDQLRPGDLVLIMGAGDITLLGNKLLSYIKDIKFYDKLATKTGNN